MLSRARTLGVSNKKVVKDRNAIIENFRQSGVIKPKFDVVVQDPRLGMRARWNYNDIDYSYIHKTSQPWFAQDIFDEFKALAYKKLNDPEFLKDSKHKKVSVIFSYDQRLYTLEAPQIIEEPRTEYQKQVNEQIEKFAEVSGDLIESLDNAGNKTAGVLTAGKQDTKNNIAAWEKIEESILKAEEYDKNDGIDSLGYNRVTNIVMTLRYFTIPTGKGKTSGKGSKATKMGLEYAECLANYNMPEGSEICGQACLAYLLAKKSTQYNYNKRPKSIYNAARKICKLIGVETRMAVTDFDKFTKIHPEYIITVMENTKDMLYRTEVVCDKPKQFVYILRSNEHYELITNIKNFVKPLKGSRKQWCHGCCTNYSAAEINQHPCGGKCRHCTFVFTGPQSELEHCVPTDARCPTCNFGLIYTGCSHSCKLWQCLECDVKCSFEHKDSHIHYEKECKGCKVYYPNGETHRCANTQTKPGTITELSICPNSKAKNKNIYDNKRNNYWCFDIESFLENIADSENKGLKEHIPALIIVGQLYKSTLIEFERALDFIKWVETGFHKGVNYGKPKKMIGHNAGSYDTYLIMQEILEKRKVIPIDNFIPNGRKIIKFQYSGCTFMDSMKHLPMSLDRCGKTFGVPVLKGSFPYTLLTKANKNYVGPIPDKKYFVTHKKNKKELMEFNSWHKSYTHAIPSEKFFNVSKLNADELLEFNLWYKRQTLIPERKHPDFKYFHTSKLNVEELSEFDSWYSNYKGKDYNLWNECRMYCRSDVHILRKSLEFYRDGNILATGLDPLNYLTLPSYASGTYTSNHMEKNSLYQLKRHEYDFVKENSFQGGRTEARIPYLKFKKIAVLGAMLESLLILCPKYVMHSKFNGSINTYYKNNECGLAYIDIMSLYPTVMRYDLLPCGIPWYAKDVKLLHGYLECHKWLLEKDSADILSIVDCNVICPKDLHHGVLGVKRSGKLLFPLDITTGSWTSVELVRAISVGYKITCINKALCSNSSRNLFLDYIDKFVSMKKKHSEDGTDYNPGLRAIAKLMLNSLWGKFGQRDLNTISKFFVGEKGHSDWCRSIALHSSGYYSQIDIHDHNESYLYATLTKENGENLHLNKTNVLLASFVTAQARLRLHTMLSKLGTRVAYHDTDSVIYTLHRDSSSNIVCGNSLGSWTDETYNHSLGMADPIYEICTVGPKTYGYLTCWGSVCIKCKGFSTGFTFSQYRDLVNSYFSKTNIVLSQTNLQFKRGCGIGKNKIYTNPGFIKNLKCSISKVYPINKRLTVPLGHRLHLAV